MKPRYFLPDIIAVAFMAFTAVTTALIYQDLPAVIATHFDVHGRANSFLPRAYGAWLMLPITLVTWAIVRFARPPSWRARVEGSLISTLACMTALFLSALQLLVLHVVLHGGTSLGRGLALLMGTMWIALALILPRVRRNRVIGVRTVWTLASDENWARTHRVASYTCLLGGALALGAGLLGGKGAPAVALVAIIVSGLVPAVYSYMLSRSSS